MTRATLLRLTVMIAAMALATIACGPTTAPTNVVGDATVIPSATAGSTVEEGAASATPAPVCTPPACKPGEMFACGDPAGCIGGCGTICVPSTEELTAPNGLSLIGPWLVFTSGWEPSPAESIWAVDARNGAAVALVENERIIGPYDLTQAVSPSAGHVAYITASDEQLHNLTLKMVTLPDGQVTTITSLTSAQTEPTTNQPDDPNFDLIRVLTEVQTLAWSPDGTRLAFMGAMQGTTSDLYVYSVVDGSITRLSGGPSQAIMPSWSPDGSYVVHFGVGGLGTGAGWGMEGAWAANSANPDDVIELYTPDSGGEEIIGWLNNDTFLVSSWRPVCGRQELRAWNIHSGLVNVLWADCFNNAAIDPELGAVAWTSQGFTEYQAGGPGIYVTADPLDPQISATNVLDRPALQLAFVPQIHQFVAVNDQNVVAVDSSGHAVNIDTPVMAVPAVSQFGDIWAWASEGYDAAPGLYIGGAAAPPDRIFEEMAHQRFWSPISDDLFFLVSETVELEAVYVYHAATGELPTKVIGGLNMPRENGAVWVLP